MKFSIIIPVYNVEKYISKCLESVVNQTYKNFEAIIINDGTLDNSQEIIDKFVKLYPNIFKSFIKKNGGLSDARNFGIKYAKGEYLVFLDSDDFIDSNYLEELNKAINENEKVDLIRVSIKSNDSSYNMLSKEKFDYKVISGQEAFIYLREKRICIETVCSYCVRLDFWKKNDFKFSKGKYHEDFGIMLIVLLKAKKVVIINTLCYNYIIRENSIMTDKDYKKKIKRVYDKLEYYDNILKEIDNIKNISKKAKNICKEYISTAVCESMKIIEGQELQEYKRELRKRKVIKNIKCNSYRNIAKKIIYSLKIYL